MIAGLKGPRAVETKRLIITIRDYSKTDKTLHDFLSGVGRSLDQDCRRTAPRIDSADLSTSSSVVDQLETEIRIARIPCHVVPPSQQMRSS